MVHSVVCLSHGLSSFETLFLNICLHLTTRTEVRQAKKRTKFREQSFAFWGASCYTFNEKAGSPGGKVMSRDTISEKQREILEFIKDCILQKGYPPSVREICSAVKLRSTSSVHAHLGALEEAGYIRRDPAKPRTIEIVDEAFNLSRREVVNVPILGSVAAGLPIFAEQNISDYFPIPAENLPNQETFMLKVQGNSMVKVGILNGDLVIVARQSTARNGEIVVALVEDGATVKRFYKENGHYRLQPENDAMEPIIVKDVTVLGKVVALYRNL